MGRIRVWVEQDALLNEPMGCNSLSKKELIFNFYPYRIVIPIGRHRNPLKLDLTIDSREVKGSNDPWREKEKSCGSRDHSEGLCVPDGLSLQFMVGSTHQ